MSTSIRFEDKIARDDYTDREARPYGQRWRDVELAADDLLAGLVDALRRALTQGLNNVAVVPGRTGLRTNAEQSRKSRSLEQLTPMVIDTILKPGIAFGIGARLALQHDRAAIREDQPVPDQEHPTLAEANAIVVLANHAGALWDEQDLAGRAVINILRYLGGDLAGQIGSDAGDQRGRNQRTRLKDIRRCWGRDAIGRNCAFVGRLVEEGELAILR